MAWTDDLKFYLKMDESAGNNAMDAHSVGPYDFTQHNTVGSATGRINGARDFELASAHYFDHADLSVADEDFSLSLWLHLESKPAGNMHAIDKIGAADVGFALFWSQASDRLTWYTKGPSAASTAVWGSSLSLATWYHVVCTHSAGSDQIAIIVNDGTPVTASHAGGITDSGSNFSIGKYTPLGLGYWDGLIDEVGFWKRVLTAGEITSLYGAGAGLAYPFTGGGGSSIVPIAMHLARLRRAG